MQCRSHLLFYLTDFLFKHCFPTLTRIFPFPIAALTNTRSINNYFTNTSKFLCRLTWLTTMKISIQATMHWTASYSAKMFYAIWFECTEFYLTTTGWLDLPAQTLATLFIFCFVSMMCQSHCKMQELPFVLKTPEPFDAGLDEAVNHSLLLLK